MAKIVRTLFILVAFVLCTESAFGKSIRHHHFLPPEPFTLENLARLQSSPAVSVLALVCSLVAMLPLTGLSLWLLGIFQIHANPLEHWSVRASKAYPVQIYLALINLYIPLFAGCIVYLITDGRVSGCLIIFLVYFFLSNLLHGLGQILTSYFIYQQRMTWLQNLQNMTCMFLVYRKLGWVYIALFFFTFATQPGWWTVVGLLSAIAFIFWLSTVGLLQMLSLFRLISPVEELREVILTLAAKANVKQEPKVYRIKWSIVNAYALIAAYSIIVTDRMFEVLTRQELESVLAHEMAHLSEGKAIHSMRYARLILPIPLVMAPSWFPWAMQLPWDNNIVTIFASVIWAIFYALVFWKKFSDPKPTKKRSWLWSLGGPLYFVFLIGCLWYEKAVTWQIFFSVAGFISIFSFLLSWRMQNMEKRADVSGSKSVEATVYANALAKMYEQNLVPAVMKGNNLSHPHLYDRLIASGLTPDFPRPEPPATRLSNLLATLTILVGIAVFWWFLNLAPG